MKKHIEVNKETQLEFNKLHSDLNFQGYNLRKKDDLLKLLMSFFKKYYNKINNNAKNERKN